MVKENVGIRLEPDLRKKLEKLAEDRGTSISREIEDAVELFIDLDPILLEKAGELAARLRIPRGIVLANAALSWFAQLEVKSRVWGTQASPLPEFVLTAQGPEIGPALYGNLLRNFLQDEKNQRRAVLQEKFAEAPERLTAEERAFLGLDKPELPSDERAELEGILSRPGFEQVDPVALLNLIRARNSGKIDRETFEAELSELAKPDAAWTGNEYAADLT